MIARLRAEVHGQVQGVGFRPWVATLAHQYGLGGWVRNNGSNASLELEGPQEMLIRLIETDLHHPPSPIEILKEHLTWISPKGDTKFVILESLAGEWDWHLPHDRAVCQECRQEFYDPRNRRYQFPFIHCAKCGPRWSVLETLPYDRQNTSLKHFPMCPACDQEYRDPGNRRFHAQTQLCWECGPQLTLRDTNGKTLAHGNATILLAAKQILEGKIVAVLGMGGYQLWADATQEGAIRRLRERKRRPAQPFATMALANWLEAGQVQLQPPEQDLFLNSMAAPIVLFKKTHGFHLANSVAPQNPYVGIMRPCTMLQESLLSHIGHFVVATSGNFSGEPICKDPEEAHKRLKGIADFFLEHDLPLVRAIDDSVMRVVNGRAQTLRCGRGLAPLQFEFSVSERTATEKTFFCAGGDLKSAVAIRGPAGFTLSQHLGDLGSVEAHHHYLSIARDLCELTNAQGISPVTDQHPDYASRSYASELEQAGATQSVQHHFAHALSVWAEHRHSLPALAFVWDGTGYGEAGDKVYLWGSECMEVSSQFSSRRRASLVSFPLPGGEASMREPRRSLLGLLWQLGPTYLPLARPLFDEPEFNALLQLLDRQSHCPATSSMGRLFDAISALLLGKTKISFEGEAAMALEFLAQQASSPPDDHYLRDAQSTGWDWRSWLPLLLRDVEEQKAGAVIARRFHSTLIEMAYREARYAQIPTVTLSGGVFQNRILLQELSERLEASGFSVFYPERIPIHDGGLAAGQAVACV